MNEIYSMELQYESLIPIDLPKKTFLSVGTVTFLVGGDELPLDFNITEGSVKGNAGSIICVNAEIKDFEPEVFMDEYRELGLSPSDLNYDFFAKHYQDTYLAEVYSEYFYTDTPKEIYLPLTLKSAVLLFQDGSVLDYSDRISVFAQKQLAEVA